MRCVCSDVTSKWQPKCLFFEYLQLTSLFKVPIPTKTLQLDVTSLQTYAERAIHTQIAQKPKKSLSKFGLRKRRQRQQVQKQIKHNNTNSKSERNTNIKLKI